MITRIMLVFVCRIFASRFVAKIVIKTLNCGGQAVSWCRASPSNAATRKKKRAKQIIIVRFSDGWKIVGNPP